MYKRNEIRLALRELSRRSWSTRRSKTWRFNGDSRCNYPRLKSSLKQLLSWRPKKKKWDSEKLENAKITTRTQESNHRTEQCRLVCGRAYLIISALSPWARSSMRLSSKNADHVLVLCLVVICGLKLREYRFFDGSSRSLYQPTLTTLFRPPFAGKYPTGVWWLQALRSIMNSTWFV